MHDKNGTPLQKGDTVLIPAVITDLYETEDYCNVGVETVHGRRPDGQKERFSAINTGVLVKFALLCTLALPLAACGSTGWGKPGSSWGANIGKTAVAGAAVGAGVGLAVGGVGVGPGAAVGAATGAVVGATLPHSTF